METVLQLLNFNNDLALNVCPRGRVFNILRLGAAIARNADDDSFASRGTSFLPEPTLQSNRYLGRGRRINQVVEWIQSLR